MIIYECVEFLFYDEFSFEKPHMCAHCFSQKAEMCLFVIHRGIHSMVSVPNNASKSLKNASSLVAYADVTTC